MTRVYVFALVERSRLRQGPGGQASNAGKTASRSLRIGRHRIAVVPVRGIHAAVERRRTQPRISEASLRDQHRVVVELARTCEAILPARFGAWIEPAELERLVEAREPIIRRALKLVRRREQMTVRIFGEDERPVRPAPAAATGAAYLQARRAATTPQLTPLAASIRTAVAALAVEERIDAGRGRLQLALHHLVDRGRSDDYEARVADVVSRSQSADTVVVSGPWPPFAFAPELWP